MLNENAKAWVKALRSGDYQQSTMSLRYKGGFCCLGVLCDLYAKQHGDACWLNDRFSASGDSSDSVNVDLPDEVREWAGLTTRSGAYRNIAQIQTLTLHNDYGASFDKIASIIESEPDGLFA